MFEQFFTTVEPPKREQSDSLLSYLEGCFTAIDHAIHSADGAHDDKWAIDKLKAHADSSQKLGAGLLLALKTFLKGDVGSAQVLVDEAMGEVDGFLETLIMSAGPEGASSNLFRMRVFDDLSRRGRGDLFHIPFDKRHLVGTSRFSLPGIPCLYAGSSSYVCWEELGRPQLERTCFTRLEWDACQTPVLDFGYTSNILTGLVRSVPLRSEGEYGEFLVASALCWPLHLAIHVPAAKRGAPFIEEYVLPQLVLRWIRNHDGCYGVRYASTHVDRRVPIGLSSNLVFPTLDHASRGFCPKLVERFKSTVPLAWSIASATGTPNAIPTPGHIYLLSDDPLAYVGTEFNGMQGRLSRLSAEAVS